MLCLTSRSYFVTKEDDGHKAHIKIDGAFVYLGWYDTAEEAAKAASDASMYLVRFGHGQHNSSSHTICGHTRTSSGAASVCMDVYCVVDICTIDRTFIRTTQ